MNDLVQWGALFAALSCCVAVAKFWHDRGKAEAKAEAAQITAAAVAGKLEILGNTINEFKVDVAREYASIKSLETAERQMTAAVDGMRSEMRGMNERLDKFLLAMVGDKP